ncbi:unnamed protein product [Brassica oleracea var. botrytis]|uniref:Uncharacterized protein n=2 Tax=Brassica TaxID=3705 RepID=A0A8D9GVV7_BRACM|nr:unnamed protein product [Brassica napus]CAG7887164.1 unnamed protein product [Brassica rapa]
MATSRLARFVSEVAPPQFVTVMRRHRAAKQKLDTIKEEEYKDDCFSGGMMMTMISGSTSKSFHVDVRRSFSVFEN